MAKTMCACTRCPVPLLKPIATSKKAYLVLSCAVSEIFKFCLRCAFLSSIIACQPQTFGVDFRFSLLSLFEHAAYNV